jgi:hypothetical protein
LPVLYFSKVGLAVLGSVSAHTDTLFTEKVATAGCVLNFDFYRTDREFLVSRFKNDTVMAYADTKRNSGLYQELNYVVSSGKQQVVEVERI